MSDNNTATAKKLGDSGYVNQNCWLARNANQPPSKYCQYCEARFRSCIFSRYLLISVVLVVAILVASYLFEKTISKTLITSIFVLVMVYGYFFDKSTKNIVAANFAEKKAKEAFRGLSRNLQERVDEQTKELQEANAHLLILDQQKSEFVSIASHQLRSPLTAIRGYSSMLLEGSFGEIPPASRDAVQRINDSSLHLVRIVEDFLNVSRIEQGRMSYVFTSVDIKKMVTDLVEENRAQAKSKHQKIIFSVDKHGKYIVTADEGKIRQVISNLIDNGIKYTPDNGTVRVNLDKDIAMRKVTISVKDDGIGMSPQTLSSLFKKFSRADGVRKIYTEGIGLGLYVAAIMMKEHHGRIWAESEGEGKGSAFYIELLAEE